MKSKPIEFQEVVVEIRSGCAEVTQCPEGVRVIVKDYDNLHAVEKTPHVRVWCWKIQHKPLEDR